MEQRNRKKRRTIKTDKSSTMMAALLLSAAFAVNCICVLLVVLPKLNAVNADSVDFSQWQVCLGIILIIALAYAAFGYYLFQMNENVFKNIKHMMLICVLIAITVLLALLTTLAYIHITLILMVSLLVALLINDKTAFLLNLLLSLSVGIMNTDGTDILGVDAFAVMLSCILGGTAAIFMLKNKSKRGNIITAGVFGGAVMCIVLLGAYFVASASAEHIISTIAWVGASALLSALLAVGSLSVWESLFDVATPARLNELSNANHPLLKQLMAEAPGTYHHSMMAAALAQAAAQRIGADHLLARVGAYYHDVGKLRRPQYFIENQKGGENIHNTLSPLESASSIIAHQKDSVKLLTKHKLPSEVIKIASEHHGNSLMSYFYNKAVSSAGNPNAINIKQYRYSGSRPSTKESAIVMLSDCCEAAVRSLGDTTQEQVEQMVKNVISSKISGSDAQLASSPLTLSDVAEIEKAFIKTFSAIMHERIQYTNSQEKENSR
ncbi:MAG: HDIG domain-containing protein [Clostridia bacterium]|nr:HDIG domain-containing protein [Clostridia bacterium]